jgi:hypothetical protein
VGKIERLDKKIAVRLDRPAGQRLKDLGVLGSHFLRHRRCKGVQKTEKPIRKAIVC